MADKQATVYVVDLGPTTADCHSGRIESDVCISLFFSSGFFRLKRVSRHQALATTEL